MTTRQLRALRGSIGAAVATIVASTAHTLSGGGAPAPWILIAVTALVSPVAVALAGRILARSRVLAIVVASQSLFHGAFAIAGGADPGASHGHMHGASAIAPVDAVTAALDPLMLVGHAVAALATWALLFHGERILRALGRGILRLLPAIAGEPVPCTQSPRLAARTREPRLASLFSSDILRRGPPVFSL